MDNQQVLDGLEALSSLREKLTRLEEFYIKENHGNKPLSLEELIEWTWRHIDRLEMDIVKLKASKRKAQAIIASDVRKERVLGMIADLFKKSDKTDE